MALHCFKLNREKIIYVITSIRLVGCKDGAVSVSINLCIIGSKELYMGLICKFTNCRHRLNIAELTKGEHDMYLMGVTMACMADPGVTAKQRKRRRLRAQYVYQGRKVGFLKAFDYFFIYFWIIIESLCFI